MEAGDGRSGMSKLERNAIDLVITDLVMPEQEGLETLRHLRLTRPELPVIAISGAFGGSFLKTARRFGAIAALPKPIDVRRPAARGAPGADCAGSTAGLGGLDPDSVKRCTSGRENSAISSAVEPRQAS